MKVYCIHCGQHLSLDADDLASLRGGSSIECPACLGQVPLADLTQDADDIAIRPLGENASGGWVAPDAEEIGRTFDSRYRIIRLLGRGGMGAVYEGFDTRLDRRVAIKILPMETGRNMDALARFEREAKAMAALDHPNIVHIHDYGSTADGHPYFVMEFIDGMDLHGLRHSGTLDLPGALEIISQVCSALHYAHNRGIIHRDIKPANIMVTNEGVAKVADFGLAKVLGTETNPRYDPTLTVSGAAMGTPDYMAPEQLEGQPVDHRADIYSLGVMLYALLTGSPPRGAWPPPSERVQIDIRLDEIVIRALQQNPSARYQAASDVKGDIDSVKFSTGGGPLPPGVEPDPLPSSRSSVPVAHHSRPNQSRSKLQPTRPQHSDTEILRSAHSLNTTMLALGTLAILIIGGLAVYLAKRKTGDTYNTEQTITTSETHNTYFTQLIALGVTTAKDLESIADIRPFGSGFVGISRESLDWNGAQDLAGKTGALLLPLDRPVGGFSTNLTSWLRESFSTYLAGSVWVTRGSESFSLDSSQTSQATDLTTRRRAMLLWETPQPIPETAAPATNEKAPVPEEKASAQEANAPVTEEKNPQPEAPRPTPGVVDIVKGTFDLLALTDPDKDRVKVTNGQSLSKANDWKGVKGALVYNSDGGSGKIASPVAIHSLSYEMEVDYERLSGNGRLHVDIPYSATNQSMTVLPIYLDAPGFRMISWQAGSKWPAGRKSSGRAIIRLDREKEGSFGRITVTVDGEKLEDWKGDFGPLLHSVNEVYPEFPGQSVPYLYSHRDSYKINAWILRIFDGEAQVLRNAPPVRPVSLPWTSIDGRTLQGEFVRVAGENLIIRRDGKEVPIAFSKLSPSSIAQARELALQKNPSGAETGFVPLFNGRDLSGWNGDPQFWSVRDGVIIAESPSNEKVAKNTYLIWQGGKVGDFELRLSYQIIAGNSGVQYRSEVRDPATWSGFKGYQYEIEAGANLMANNGGLYEEGGSRKALAHPAREFLANPGEKVEWSREGARKVIGNLGASARFRSGDWNDLAIICKGHRLIHQLNGVTTIDMIDDDSECKATSGVLALQLHGGSPQKVLFKNIRIKQTGNF